MRQVPIPKHAPLYLLMNTSSFLRSLTPSNPATPLDYVTPPFPSLYWPFPIKGGQANYLYHSTDIWRFTVVWTLLFFGAVHVAASGYAMVVQPKNWKVIWIAPLVFAVIGGIEAFIAGSVVGGL
jgi:Putative transmembrane protein 170